MEAAAAAEKVEAAKSAADEAAAEKAAADEKAAAEKAAAEAAAAEKTAAEKAAADKEEAKKARVAKKAAEALLRVEAVEGQAAATQEDAGPESEFVMLDANVGEKAPAAAAAAPLDSAMSAVKW